MKNTVIIAKNEFKRYFTSPLAYVYLIAFLILNGSFAIYFGHFFERGRADLLPMFGFQPWLYLLFIPGISMRLWAEEFKSKSIVQIMTMPVTTTSLVWGKFLASWLFCAIALILTFPFWLTVNFLGQPDNGVILLSYFGSLTLAGCMLAISQTMSSLTKNQVIALVLSVIANLLFFLSSLEYVLSLFRLFLPLSIVDMIASFSFITHFQAIAQGLLELRDVIFYASIILLFNFTTEIIVSFKTSGTSTLVRSGRRLHYILLFCALLLGFIGLNLLANNHLRGIRFDLTEEHNFTLTPATRKILQDLPSPVTAKIFYSKILSERNPDFRGYFDRVRLLLQQYENISEGKFTYQINYVEPLDESEDYAIASGLHSLPVIDQSQAAFFGIVFTDSLDNKKIIPFLPLERQSYIEQDITEAVYAINNNRPLLGILSYLPVNSESINNIVTPRWELLNRLDNFYNIRMINRPEDITQDFKAIMIIHPKHPSEAMVKALQNYSYQGGKILLFVDIASEALNNLAPVDSRPEASDLNGLDKIWGFHYYPDVAATDLENSLLVNASGTTTRTVSFTQDIVQFLLKENNFNPSFSGLSRLKQLLFSSATVIEPDKNQHINFVPLISLSRNSALIPAELIRRGANPADLLRRFKADGYTKYIAARITSTNLSKAFDLIVVGDTDFLYDSYWGKNIFVGDKQYFIPLLDNANFVLNSLDLLTGNAELLSLRGQTEKLRPFTGVEHIRKAGLREAKIKENEIMDNIDFAKTGIQEIWNKKTFEQRENFTPDELALIAGIRKKLNSLRQDLQKVREESRFQIQKIDFAVKFVNIYALPLLFALALLLFQLKRRKFPHARSTEKLKRRPAAIMAVSLLLLAAGLASSRFVRLDSSEDLIEKPLFDKLPQQINNVSEISLATTRGDLAFAKENGIWTLKGQPHFMVLQDRIRSFLSALLEARYFEKKSDKVEHLAHFGLQDLTDPASPKTEVVLKDSNGRQLVRFDIGRYDIDIGRGSRAAYVKFPPKFQVWSAAADFIDLSPDFADWTFSTLWNLRLGRLISFDSVTDSYRISLLARAMLNTRLSNAQTSVPGARELFSFRLLAENNQNISYKFFQSGGKYFVKIEYAGIPNEKTLQLYEKYTKDVYYEINKKDLENIRNVITAH